jgi:cyclase
MLKNRVMPCLLLSNARLVKTIKFRNPAYIGAPVNAVMIYNEKEVDELVFLDITASVEEKEPPYKIISEIATECFMPFAYGGGIRDLDVVKKIFSLGAEKVVINTHAVENPEFIKKASGRFGSQSIVVSIDVKKSLLGKYNVYTHSGRSATKLDPVDFAVQMEKLGAGEIFLNSIDRDGTMEGFDLELIKKVSGAISIPLIACGGAGTYEDIGTAVKAGASAVAAGSLFVYQGKNRAVLINFPMPEELGKILA